MGNERYRVAPLGLADDFQDADDTHLSFEEAQRAAHAYQFDLEGPKRKGGITVAQAMQDYVAWMKVHRVTGAGVEARAALHILPDLGKCKVSELTTRQLERWRDELATKPALLRPKASGKQNARPAPTTEDEIRARRATANKILTMLKAALNKAFRDDLVADDKAWRRLKPFPKVTAARPDFLTEAEAQRLLNAADKDSGFRDLILAALHTGARFGELCRLRVKDFAHGKIAIHKSKTGKTRDVRLTEEGQAFFASLTVGRDGEEFMLMNHRLGRGWHKSEQARPMREACRHAKIKPVGIHALRHTYASLSIMNGVPMLVVARNLGHRDTRMIEHHYGHLTPSYEDEAIAKGAPRFGAVKPSNVRVMK
jgi:integrase